MTGRMRGLTQARYIDFSAPRWRRCGYRTFGIFHVSGFIIWLPAGPCPGSVCYTAVYPRMKRHLKWRKIKWGENFPGSFAISQHTHYSGHLADLSLALFRIVRSGRVVLRHWQKCQKKNCVLSRVIYNNSIRTGR